MSAGTRSSGERWLRAGAIAVLALLAGAMAYAITIGLVNLPRIAVQPVAGSGDAAIVGLVLLAIGTVLFAPIAGRSGMPALATALMIVAAGAGVGAFALALVATVRAARSAPRAPIDREEP